MGKDQTTARYLLCMVTRLSFAPSSVSDQYPMDRFVSSSCFCGNSHPTCLSYASVSIVICPVELRKLIIGYGISACCNALIVHSFFSLKGTYFVG